jgi:stearoyl-CoA desaturase (delta-9 desaturase)
MEFKAVRNRLERSNDSSTWKELLEQEYAQFVDTIRQWQQLQMERVQSGKQKLAERFETETASLAARYRELERRLKMQQKRVALLSAQVSL